VSYVYFPTRDPSVDPANVADALSESIANEYGQWFPYVGTITVNLAGDNVLCRNSSIKADSPSGVPDYYGGITFELASPLDLTLPFERFAFAIAAINKGGNANLDGTGYFSFRDSSGKHATVNIGFSLDGNYNQRSFAPGNFQADSGFDWSDVVGFDFIWWCINVNPVTWDGYSVWIDVGPYLAWKVTLPTLTVVAKNTRGSPVAGKSIQLTNPQGFSQTYALPMGPVGLSVGDWTITVLDTDFVYWSDGATSKTQSFHADYGMTFTFIAVFESGGNGGGDDTLLIAGAVVLTIVLIWQLVT
jgi:hypothetical protein